MRILFYIILFQLNFITLFASSSKYIDFDSIKGYPFEEGSIAIDKKTDLPLNGYYEINYGDDGYYRYAMVLFENGKVNGIAKFYLDNWKLASQDNYKNGYKEGLSLDYYPDGELNNEALYKHGEKHGDSIGYFKNAQIQYKMYFDKGKRHGTYVQYYENGNLKLKKEYRKGIEIGHRQIYYKNKKMAWDLSIDKKKAFAYKKNGQLDVEIDVNERLMPIRGWKYDNHGHKVRMNRAELILFTKQFSKKINNE